jgi:uncharacterized protein with GYD domain
VAKYLYVGNYQTEGVKGLLKEGGSSRRAAVQKAVGALGGTIDAFYYGLGEDDVYVIVDVPDTASALAVSLAVNATGAVRLRTIALVPVEDVDAASHKHVLYRAPGA